MATFNTYVKLGTRGNSLLSFNLSGCTTSNKNSCTALPNYQDVLHTSFDGNGLYVTGLTLGSTNFIYVEPNRMVSGHTCNLSSLNQMISISGIPTPTPTPSPSPTSTPTPTPTPPPCSFNATIVYGLPPTPTPTATSTPTPTPTGTPTPTPTNTPTVTPTPTQTEVIPVEYQIDNSASGSSSEACASATTTSIVYAQPGYTVPIVTMILYNSTSLINPFIGSSGWRKLTGPLGTYAVEISTSGEITNYVTCS
jgi:hypothetical protein